MIGVYEIFGLNGLMSGIGTGLLLLPLETFLRPILTFDFRVYLEKALDKVLGGVFNFGKEKQESLEAMFMLKTRREEI